MLKTTLLLLVLSSSVLASPFERIEHAFKARAAEIDNQDYIARQDREINSKCNRSSFESETAYRMCVKKIIHKQEVREYLARR